MIGKDCFTAAWIEEKSQELLYNDKNIVIGGWQFSDGEYSRSQ